MSYVDEAAASPTNAAADRRAPRALAAELAALVRRGGLRPTLLASGAAALVLGAAAMAVMHLVSSGDLEVGARPEVTVPVEVTSATAAVLFSIGVVMHVGRSMQDGAVAMALSVVPDRARMYTARLGAVMLLAAAMTFVLVVVVAGSALLLAGGTAGLVEVTVALVSGPLAAAAVAALAFTLGVLTARSTAGLLALLGWWILVPLAILVVRELLPAWLGSLAQFLSAATPTALLARATTVSTYQTEGLGDVVQGVLGLLAWLAVLVPLAYVVFRRRSV